MIGMNSMPAGERRLVFAPYAPPLPFTVELSLGAARSAVTASPMGELRARMLAGWVAENRLAEHRARGDWLPLGIQRGSEREAGIEFAWREEIIATPHPAFRRIDVFVFAPPGESRALAHFTGFVVNPPRAVK